MEKEIQKMLNESESEKEFLANLEKWGIEIWNDNYWDKYYKYKE